MARNVGRASGKPDPSAGAYLRADDPKAEAGQGAVLFTRDPAEAMVLTMEESHALFRLVPKARPRRVDGKPNRPLTAFTRELLPPPATGGPAMMRIRIRDVSPNPRRQGRELDFRATPYGRLLHPPTPANKANHVVARWASWYEHDMFVVIPAHRGSDLTR